MKLIYLISRVFLSWTFFKFSDPLCSKRWGFIFFSHQTSWPWKNRISRFPSWFFLIFFFFLQVKITAIACVCCYLLGLPCCSYAGQYILDLMDTYGAGFAVLWIAFWECVGFMWIYKVTNFSKDIKLMLGSEPSWFWKIMWAVVCPAFLLVIFCFSINEKIINPPT